MRKGLLILAILFLSGACRHASRIPDDVLPPDKMRVVLWDMLRADQFSSNFIQEKDTNVKRAEVIRLYQQVFAIHHTDKETFRRSFIFYKTHPEILHGIADSLSQVSLAPTAPVPVTQPVTNPAPGTPDTGTHHRVDTPPSLHRQMIKPVPLN